MKRLIAMLLIMCTCISAFAACGKDTAPNTPETTAETAPETTAAPTVVTEPVQPGEEGKYLKVLTLGNSGAVDCGHFLTHIAAAEGYENFKLATLYYSGCNLAMHVGFMSKNEPVYKLYLSSTDEPDSIPTIMNGLTMEQALRYDYWDIIVMQGGSWELGGNNSAANSNNIQLLQKYSRENCLNPNVQFVWHMGWVAPTDNTLRDTYPYPENNVYYSRYLPYGDNRNTLFTSVVKGVQEVVVPDDTFQYIIPTGVAMENALSSYWEEKDIHRDYYHATDLARVMVSYVWLCRIFGIEELSEIKLDKIPVAFFKSTQDVQDRMITDEEKALILESVNNALNNPFEITQSQYTTAPQ